MAMTPEAEYSIDQVNGHEWHDSLDPLYRRHYAEMEARLNSDGIPIGPYAPRLAEYFRAMDGGWLLTYIVRSCGTVVGYSNVYLTNDMHNGEAIAVEDTIYILPDHRNGIGKRLVKHILSDLKERGVKRVNITPVTDLRVGKIWSRMGFRHTADLMTFVLNADQDHVRGQPALSS
jgi:L-amino acid N-acyltransferase YncA